MVFEAAGRYRFQGVKRFRGHGNSGYAILPGFSTDGRFLMSGDVSGKVWFWDWKTMKNHRTLQAHDQVCMGSEWHPTMASRVRQVMHMQPIDDFLDLSVAQQYHHIHAIVLLQ